MSGCLAEYTDIHISLIKTFVCTVLSQKGGLIYLSINLTAVFFTGNRMKSYLAINVEGTNIRQKCVIMAYQAIFSVGTIKICVSSADN